MFLTASNPSRSLSSPTRLLRFSLSLLLAVAVIGTLFAQGYTESAKVEYGQSGERALAGARSPSYKLPQHSPFQASIDSQRTLRIEGTDAAETIIARVIGDPESIVIEYRVTDGGTPQTSSFRLDAFDSLVLNARGGADFVNIIDARELLSGRRKVLKLDGGNGDNIVVVSHLPFQPETARRMMELQGLSLQLEGLATRAGEAVSQALTNDAMRLIESFRVDLADTSKLIASDADTQLFGPAQEMVERNEAELTRLADSLSARSDAIEKQHADLVAGLKEDADSTKDASPLDDNDEPDDATDMELDADGPYDLGDDEEVDDADKADERLLQLVLKLGDDARAEIELFRRRMESDAATVEQRAAGFEGRAEELSTKAELLAARSEADLTAAADRVVAVVADLNSMKSKFEEAALAVREEIQIAVSTTVTADQAKASESLGVSCNTPIVTTQTYSGDGFFYPIWDLSSSWSITGGVFSDFIIGGTLADDIKGGPGGDFVFGNGGNDHIHGDDGNDFLVGERIIDSVSYTGDDCIWGDNGVDILIGDNVINTGATPGGNDELSGGAGVDIVVGDDVFFDIFNQTQPGGKDTIEGNEDVDILFGCGGADNIKGNADIDFAEGNGGADVIDGGDGRNVAFSFCNTTIQLGGILLGGRESDTVIGGAGIDIIIGNQGQDTLIGKDQVDFMFGFSDEDKMFGDAGGQICNIGIPIRLGNLMLGGTEADRITAGGDLDVMLGEDGGDDIRGYDGSFQHPFAFDIDIQLGGNGNDLMRGDNEPFFLRLSMDYMFGGPGIDDMNGGNNNDFMFGQSGVDKMRGDSNLIIQLLSADLMSGGPGSDWMHGGNSLDAMLGKGGADTMLGDNEFVLFSPDFMFGGPGSDQMNGGSSFDIMGGGDDADNMLGDSNLIIQPLSIDVMFGEGGPDFMDGGNAPDFMSGGSGGDKMLGDDSTPVRFSLDIMAGDGGNDDMNGGNTKDFISGGDGDDKVVGDPGLSSQQFSNDWLWGDDGCDTILGGRAIDKMFGGNGVDQMHGQRGVDVISGGPGSDTISGGELLDLIWGDEANDLIHGNDGADRIRGGDGNDCLYGDDGRDRIWGNEGDDCIHGNDGRDRLRGNRGNDLIFGDDERDRIWGGNDDDKLDGGDGRDRLRGGSGSDELWGGPGNDSLRGEIKHQSGSSGLECDCHLDPCIPPVVVKAEKCVINTSELHTTPQNSSSGTPQITIGEIIRYRLTVTLPEGPSPFLSLADHLPPGLTYLGNAKVAFVSTGGAGVITSNVPALSGSGLNVSASGVGSCSGPTPTFALPASQVGGGPFSSGSDPIFILGSLTNTHTDPNLEYVIVEFNALVNNLPTNAPGPPNQNGATLSNFYDVLASGNGASAPIATSNTSNVTIVEPKLDVQKTVTTSPGTSLATFTVTLKNTGTADAFDVVVNDVLPAGLGLASPPPSVSVTPASCSQPALAVNGNALTVTAPTMPVGCSVTLTFTVSVSSTCTPQPNIAQVRYTSLLGGDNSVPVGTRPNNTGSFTPGSTGNVDGDRLYNGSAQASLPGGGSCKPACECQLKISRFRQNGPGGSADEFVEIFNSSDSPVTVSACSQDANPANGIGVFASAGNGTTSNAVSLVCQIPGNTVIPGRSYFLCSGLDYSLGALGDNGGSSHSDQAIGTGSAIIGDIPNDAGLALLDVGTNIITACSVGGFLCPTGFHSSASCAGNPAAVALDKVGFLPYGVGSPANIYPSLAPNYCEGPCLQPIGDASVSTAGASGVCPPTVGPAGTSFPVSPGGTISGVALCYGESGQYEILRRQTTWSPTVGTLHRDTDNNPNDFIFVSPNPATTNVGQIITGVGGVTSVLGAAGPYNLTAPPDLPSVKFPQLFIPPTVFTPPFDPEVVNHENGPLGTFTIRLRFTNNSGQPINGLRFKVDTLTTLCGTQRIMPNSVQSIPANGNAQNLAAVPTCGVGATAAILKALNSSTTTGVSTSFGTQTFLGTVLEDLRAGSAPGPLSPFGGGIDSSFVIIDSTAVNPVGDGVTGGKGTFSHTVPVGGFLYVQFKFGVVRGGTYQILISPMGR